MKRVDQPSMNSVGKQCNELKEQYDLCFQSWFSEKFLKGETNDEICSPLFKVYQDCLKTVFMEPCRELKEEYDKCFNVWFSQKFLKGDSNDEMCAELLKVYKSCVKKTMQENQIEFKEVVKDNLGTEEEHKVPPKS